MKNVLMLAALLTALVVVYRAKQAAAIAQDIQAEFDAHPLPEQGREQ